MSGIRMTRGTKGFGVAIGCLALALVVAACAGSKSKTAASASSAPAVSPTVSAAPSSSAAGARAGNTAAFAAYTACLAQHGVTVPSFSRGARPSGSFSRPAGTFSRPPGGFSRAPGASRGPGGGGFGGAGGFLGSPNPSTSAARAACASLLPAGAVGGGRTISATTFAAFKSCMSDNGVTITTTDPQQAMQGLDRTDPKIAAALKVCQPILGQGQQGVASGAPPTPGAAAS
jgi:hypothetical protein